MTSRSWIRSSWLAYPQMEPGGSLVMTSLNPMEIRQQRSNWRGYGWMCIRNRRLHRPLTCSNPQFVTAYRKLRNLTIIFAQQKIAHCRLFVGIKLSPLSDGLVWFQTPPEGATFFQQSAITLGTIRFLVGPLGAVLLFSAIAMAWFYPLTRERHARIRRLPACKKERIAP